MKTIAEYLTGKVVFLTGSTGFLGQPLIEKILFVAPDVERIYTLIRPKHQFGGRVLSAQDRLERELFGSSVFDRMRGVHGDGLEDFLRQKLVAVAGDIGQQDLGIDSDILSELRSKIDIVINSAAVVSFDAPLNEALEFNVRAAGRVADFAVSCADAVLVHVSTAYVSGATHKRAQETIYHSAPRGTTQTFPMGQFTDFRADIKKIEEIIAQVEEDSRSPDRDREFKLELVKRSNKGKKSSGRRRVFDTLRKRWIQTELVERGMAWARERGWNDTYTYTKAMGEQVVLSRRGDMPTVFLRPSVIESSLSEPCPGWLDGLRMADPLIAAIGKGRLKSLPLNPDVLIDLVPVDVVVNALLASIPVVAEKKGYQVYQVATGSKNPILLGELYEHIFHYFKNHPMLDNAGRPIKIRRLKFPNPAAFRLSHRLKSVPLNTAEKTLERLSVFESTQKVRRRLAARSVARQKLYYYGEIYEPYLNLDCQFEVDNLSRLYESLDPSERKRFNFDVTRLNWRHYIQNVHIPGVKKYILKVEGAGTMELADETSRASFGSLLELVSQSAQRFGDKPALQIKRDDQWERIRFNEIEDAYTTIAESLAANNLQKGDRVVLFAENKPAWGIHYLAAVSRGLVVVPIDWQTWHKEVWSIARYTDARVILLSEKCFGRLKRQQLESNESSEKPIRLLNLDRSGAPFDEATLPRSTGPNPALKGTPAPVETDPDDPVSIIFTQGTAVDPKGAIHTHRNFLNNLLGVNRYLPIQPDDAILSILPLYHALEFTCGFLMALYGGATVTYTSTLKPRVIMELMRETGTTCMLGVPTFYALLRDDIERRILKTSKSAFKSNLMHTSKQLSRSVERRFGRNIGRQLFARVHQEFGGKIRLLVSGGSCLGQELYQDFKDLGMTIYEGYGLTETAPVLTVNPINLSRPDSAGKPLPGVEVRLDHPDRDGIGEIVVRSPSLMKGYYSNEAATRKVMEDDWFNTGDLGWVDVDGYIYITGRTKDVIVTGAGKNVYPQDLEANYGDEIAEIKAICVIGIKNGLTEEVHAVINPDSSVLSELPQKEWKKEIQRKIQQFSRELPSYHRLQQIHIWRDALPCHPDQSIDRVQVKASLEEKLNSARQVRQQQGSTGSDSRQQRVYLELSRVSGFPEEEITPSSDLYLDLGLDSLMAIELLLFAEHEFGISIADERASKIEKVGEFLDELERVSGSPEPAPRSAPKKETISSTLPLSDRPLLDRMLLNTSFGGMRAIFRSYIRLATANSEVIPKGEAYIIAANHSSHLDTSAILTAIHLSLGKDEARRLHVLGARDYFFKSPIKGWLVSRLLNVVPIERKETSLSSLRLVKKILKRGEPVVIFPEGTRSRDGNLQEFKPGLALMAMEVQVPIIPTFIDGAHELMPVGQNLPKPGSLRVVFGPPILMENYSRNGAGEEDVYRQIARDVRMTIADMAARHASA